MQLRRRHVLDLDHLTVVLDDVQDPASHGATTVNLALGLRGLNHGSLTALTTTSPAGLAATSDIALGGQQVGPNGAFGTPQHTPVSVRHGTASVTVRPGKRSSSASAEGVWWEPAICRPHHLGGSTFPVDGPGAPRSAHRIEVLDAERCHVVPSAGVAEAHAVSASAVRVKSPRDLRTERRRSSHGCWDHLIAAPLWPLHAANLGTLLRTCDAVGACLAVPKLPWVPEALARGNTLRKPACVHWTGDQLTWLARQKARDDTTTVGAELADEAVRLADLRAARNRTVLILGHERDGIPPEAVELLDVAVEIPMVGTGSSLNVAVAGSLVLYRLAGLL